jgi:hypothetical protein
MIAADRLVRIARDYELLAASCAERAGLAGVGGGQREAAAAFILAAIVLREVAAAIDEE